MNKLFIALTIVLISGCSSSSKFERWDCKHQFGPVMNGEVIIGNSALIGIVIYSNYSLYTDHGVDFWELFYDGFIYLSLGAVLAYLLIPKTVK